MPRDVKGARKGIAVARAVVNYGLILGLALVVFWLGAMLLSVDIDAKHPEAPAVRTFYREGTCEGTELWFAPVRGTVLVLCGIPQSPLWGGMIYRVTERNGDRLLNEDAYEATVLCDKRRYWDRVIVRDGYFPLANYPSVARFFREWWDY